MWSCYLIDLHYAVYIYIIYTLMYNKKEQNYHYFYIIPLFVTYFLLLVGFAMLHVIIITVTSAYELYLPASE